MRGAAKLFRKTDCSWSVTPPHNGQRGPDTCPLLPVVAAARQAAGDAGPGQGCGAGVVAQAVWLCGAHAAALHVAAAGTQAQAARHAAHAGPVAQAGVVEARLCHRGGV